MKTERVNWIKQNPYACVLPFNNHGINLEFNGDPSTTPWLRDSCCCHLENNRSGFEDVQQSVLDNQPNSRCWKCYQSEQTSGTSERTMALLSLSDADFDQFVKEKTSPIMSVGIKFSNLCNLSCRSCSPTFSSKYAEVHNLRVPAVLSRDLSNEPEVWRGITDNIKKYIDQGKFVIVTLFGGESLIQPGVSKLMEWVDQHNLKQSISISVTSNLTRIEKLKSLSEFRNLHLAASIDSVEQNYEYVRYPAQWSLIQQNLEQLAQLIKNRQINNFTVQPLFSLNNAFYLDEILNFWHSWIKSNNLDSVVFKNVVMHRPFHLTIQNLPVQYRGALFEIFKKALAHPLFDNNDNYEFFQYLQGMSEFLQGDQKVYDQFELFLDDTARHDCATNSWMQQGNQRFYQLLSPQDQQQLETFQQKYQHLRRPTHVQSTI